MTKLKLTYRQLARLILNKHTKGQSLVMNGETFNKLRDAYIIEKNNIPQTTL